MLLQLPALADQPGWAPPRKVEAFAESAVRGRRWRRPAKGR